MNLDDLIMTWKSQDQHIKMQLQNVTIQYLIKEKSKNVLKKIEQYLRWELLSIAFIAVCCVVLFFTVDIPLTPVRWVCFIIFCLTASLHITFYIKGTRKIKLSYGDDLETNLQRIIQGLTQFQHQRNLMNIPIIFVCIIMFAGSQNIIVLIPWMLLEFLLWRRMLFPKMRSRFADYKSDLEYTLRQLRESNG